MVVRVFYRQGRDTNHFLNSNGSVSRTNYLRVLAVASIDILLTLPTGVTNLVLVVLGSYEATCMHDDLFLDQGVFG